MLVKRILLATTIALLFWLPLPYASNRPGMVNIAEFLVFANTALCTIAWMFGWISYRGSKIVFVVCVLMWSLWLAWITAQYVPWPSEFIAEWATHRYALELSIAGIGLQPADQIAISIDRDLTFSHLQESFAYGCLFLSILLLAGGSRSTLRIFCWALVILGVLQASFGSFMVLSGLEHNLLGPKEAYIGSATGTFVNRNHFAGYLQLCASVAIGLMVVYSGGASSAENLWTRFLDSISRSGTNLLFVRISLVILVIGLILSQSRMGNAAALGGLLIAGMLYAVLKRRADWRKMLFVLASLLLVDLWLVGDWFGLDRLAERYEKTDIETSQRAVLFPVLRDMGKTYSPLGSGLGTFEVAYPEFQSPLVRGRPRHAHNDYAQFFIETGWPGIVLLGTIVATTLMRSLLIIRRRRDSTYSGVSMACAMAVSCIAIHSVTDFNMQIPANAATLVFIMALPWACNLRRRSKKPSKARPSSLDAIGGN